MISQLLIRVLYLVVTPAFIQAEYIPPGPAYRCPTNKVLLHPCKCLAESDNGIKVECINTNLATMSVGLNNLASYKIPIEELRLDKCNFARLYGNVFHKLKIRILRITNTPLESIDEHLFHGTNLTLNELYIQNTSLTQFPKESLKILGNLTVLQLDTHFISSLPDDAFTGDIVGVLQKFHMSNGQLKALSIESITQLKKLKTLDLHGNNLTELKRNQFRGLRDAEVLDLSFNQLKKVDSTHLADLTKLSWCNVSHNSLTELTRGAFARNAVLRVLNMSFNNIKRLDTNSFRGMRFLRRLYLSDNLISDVGRGTFSSVTRIGTIDLARNQIKKVDYQMFYQLNYVEIIDLSENNISIIEKLSFKDLYLTNINLSRNAIDKIEVNSFENCVNISVLDLSYNRLKSIQKKAFDEITYADYLQLSYNYLTDLSQVPIQNMTGLRILNVSHNEIEIIPKNTFPKLYELHTIDMSYNNLTEIWNGVFQTLFSLRNLNLSHNSLSVIKPSTFGTLPTLLNFDISYNQLSDVAKGAFAKFSGARTLLFNNNQLQTIFQLPISVGSVDFSYNNLQEIPEKTWPSMNAVLELNFRGNRFANNLIHGSFSPLLTLRVLDLSENGISEIPWPALGDLTSLQYLYLERNNLTKLPKGAFGRLPVVFELNMAFNQISNVSTRAFEGLLQLLTLNLTHNNISYIPNGAFQGLVSLRTLDLSFNRLEKLDNKTSGLLDDCLSLETLNLSHNKMSFITRKTFPSSPWIPYKLREIDLSYNVMPIITYDLVFGTGRVEKLNLSHNMVTEIRPGVIGNLTSLKILDLSHNEIDDLITLGQAVKKEEKLQTNNGIFRLPLNLTELYLDHNSLPRLPLNNIKNCTKLKVLNVAYNQLTDFQNDLVTMVKADTKIFMDGNPLTCDCFLRPIKRLIDQRMDMQDIYNKLECATPLHLANQRLIEVPDDRLTCVDNIENKLKQAQNDIYDVTSDLKFRDVKFSRKKIIVRWLVNNIIDIADFYILIRQKSQILYETNVPYWTRLFELNVEEIESIENALKNNEPDLQLCVLARDSKYMVRNWFKNQCTMFPGSLGISSGVEEVKLEWGILIALFTIYFM